MKLSVSLSETDVEILDDYVRRTGLASRSAALQHAVRLLRDARLGRDYADAWATWEADGHAEAWEPTVGDGLHDASR